jgi:hypothetical protein
MRLALMQAAGASLQARHRYALSKAACPRSFLVCRAAMMQRGAGDGHEPSMSPQALSTSSCLVARWRMPSTGPRSVLRGATSAGIGPSA